MKRWLLVILMLASQAALGGALPEPLAGPRSAVAGTDAYAPTFSWHPGASQAERQRVVLVGVMISLLLLGCLLMPRRSAAIGVLSVAIVSTGLILIWRNNLPDLSEATGRVIVEQDRLHQIDTWRYFTARSDGCRHVIPLHEQEIPILADENQASDQQMSIEETGPAGRRLIVTLRRSERLALLSRRNIMFESPPKTLPTDFRGHSPMLELVQRCYLEKGDQILSVNPGSSTEQDDFGTIRILRAPKRP